MGESFEVVFHGEVKPGTDLAVVKGGLARLFGQPLARIEPLFSGREVVITTGIDRARALRYQAEMARVGALALIRSVGVVEEVDFSSERSDIHPRSSEFSLSGVFAALMVCPRCGHEQLEGEYCAQCKVSFKDLELEERRRRKREKILAQRRSEGESAERIATEVEHGDTVEVADPPPPPPGTARRLLWPVAGGIALAIGLSAVAWFLLAR